jgi:hypothetical protein
MFAAGKRAREEGAVQVKKLARKLHAMRERERATGALCVRLHQHSAVCSFLQQKAVRV